MASYEYRINARRMRTPIVILVSLALALLLFATTGEAQAQATFTCDKWASVNGSDANAGTKEAPVQTVKTLANKLQPGETGCLTAGETFHMDQGWGIIEKSGLAGSPITIRSAPEGKANLTGRYRIDGNYVVVRDLNFRGLAAVGDTYPKTNHIHVVGDDVSLINNDITSPKGICVSVGTIASYLPPDDPNQTANSAKNFKLDGNRIYGCGVDTYLEPTDSGMHGIYLAYTEDAKITNNYIYDNRVRGLQLYPRAERTLVEYNVLDGNSGNLNIGGSSHEGGYYVSRDTIVRNNIISNSTFKWHKDTAQVFGNYKVSATDTEYNNVITENCVYHQDPTKNFGGSGYTHTNNKTDDPLYKDRTNKNFELQAGSPCAGKGPQTGDSPPPPTTCAEATISSEGVTGTGTKDDPFKGTSANDVIVGTSGEDTIMGLGGEDLLCGRGGYDTLKGGPGKDTLDGEAGGAIADYSYSTSAVKVNLTNRANNEDILKNLQDVKGSRYADILIGDSTNNSLYGEGGNDKLRGLMGTIDYLEGGSGTDTAYFPGKLAVEVKLYTNPGTATGQGSDKLVRIENIFGSTSDDTIHGSVAANILWGAEGADTINGRGGNDKLYGMSGNDKLYGSSGNDIVNGGAGDDPRLVGGPGDDKLYGSYGNDWLHSRDNVTANDWLNAGPGTDKCVTDEKEASVRGCEK